jgi:hypothetical protein
MPNELDHFDEIELPKLVRFFAPIAKTLEDFCVHHNLRLERYQKESSTWNFLFRHPDAGIGSISITPFGPKHVSIFGYRTLSDFERFRRSVYSAPKQIVALDDPRLSEVLTSLLRELVALSPDKLVPDGRDYSQVWVGPRTYYTYVQSLPLPVL